MCEIFDKMSDVCEGDAIVSIEYLGAMDTIDIDTDGNHLFFANGILTHNCSHESTEFDHSHISGGLSKINTADNVMAIFVTPTMKENGRYQLQFLKTRSSSGVGSKVELGFNTKTLRIHDLAEGEDSHNTINTGSILDKLKQQAVINNTTQPKDEGMDVLKRSASLRDMLNKLE